MDLAQMAAVPTAAASMPDPRPILDGAGVAYIAKVATDYVKGFLTWLRKGEPIPEWIPLGVAGIAGGAAAALYALAAGMDLTQPAIAAKTIVDGITQGGGGAVYATASHAAARPFTVSLPPSNPCCNHPDCRTSPATLTPPPASPSPSASGPRG